MLDFRARKRLRERVGRLFVGWAIDEFDRARLDYVTNEMVADVDVFRARVILSAVSESDGRLVVAVESGRRAETVREEVGDKAAQPQRFFDSVGRCHVLQPVLSLLNIIQCLLAYKWHASTP